MHKICPILKAEIIPEREAQQFYDTFTAKITKAIQMACYAKVLKG